MVRLAAILLLALSLDLLAADQRGAESTKKPVAADIVNKVTVPDGRTDVIGNVRVTYSDGTKDLWTTKRDASLPRVAPNGVVGWTVNGPETQMAASYTLRPNGTLVLCQQGKIVARAESAKGFIEEWHFVGSGKQLVLLTRGAHGPADIELHDAQTGKLIETVKASGENIPAWAKPFAER